jgi:hypothetical protein
MPVGSYGLAAEVWIAMRQTTEESARVDIVKLRVAPHIVAFFDAIQFL